MGGQLEVQHPLRVAGRFPGGGVVTFQYRNLPATPGQAGGSGTARQPGPDHQGFARPFDTVRAAIPGHVLTGGCRPSVGAAHHLPLLADPRHFLHGEAGFDQAAPHPASGGEGAQYGARV
ncbi:hypothetical protein D3C79_833380 [compost metagenome]